MHDLITPVKNVKLYRSITAMMVEENIYPKELRFQIRGFSEDYKLEQSVVNNTIVCIPYYVIITETLIVKKELLYPKNNIYINDSYLGPLGIWEYYCCICSINHIDCVTISDSCPKVYRHNQTFILKS